MGPQGGGDNLQAEGLSPEYLLDGCYPVLLLRDAATGIGRVDEQYVHGPRPWWSCRTAERQENVGIIYKMRFAVSMKSPKGQGEAISLSKRAHYYRVGPSERPRKPFPAGEGAPYGERGGDRCTIGSPVAPQGKTRRSGDDGSYDSKPVTTRGDFTMSEQGTLEEKCINTIRFLAADAIEKAKVRPSRHADGGGGRGLHPLDAAPEAQPGRSAVAGPGPLRPVRRARLDAPLCPPLPDRL